MLFTLSLSTIIWAALISFFLYSLFLILLKPLYHIRYYTKQGAHGEYYPIIGGFGKNVVDAPITGDCMFKDKEILQKKNPNVRLFVSNAGSRPILALVDPALIKEFLHKQGEVYIKEERFIAFDKYLVGNGLVSSEGKTWKKHRKIISHAFHFELLKDMVPEIVQTTNEMFEKLANKKDLQNVDIMEEFQAITGEIVGRIFFGQNFSQYQLDGEPLTKVITTIGTEMEMEDYSVWAGLFGPWFVTAGILPQHRKLLNRMKRTREFFRKVVEEAKTQRVKHEKANLLDILLDSQTKSPEEALSTDEIIDEFLTFFIAGTDTTGHLLTLATYYLLQNPEAHEKVLDECLSLLKNNEILTFEKVDQMSYTLGVLKETLRLTNPALSIFFRKALKDDNLCDLKIKKGTLVTFFTNHNCIKEEYFDNPNEFQPERWLAGNEANAKWKKEPFSYIPFSAGVRNCIGQHLALLKGKIILSLFLKKFEMELPEGYRMRLTARFLYEPLDPLKLRLKLRV